MPPPLGPLAGGGGGPGRPPPCLDIVPPEREVLEDVLAGGGGASCDEEALFLGRGGGLDEGGGGTWNKTTIIIWWWQFLKQNNIVNGEGFLSSHKHKWLLFLQKKYLQLFQNFSNCVWSPPPFLSLSVLHKKAFHPILNTYIKRIHVQISYLWP